jgi:hypothetical protein
VGLQNTSRGFPRDRLPFLHPQKDTLTAKGSFTAAGFLFVPSQECALGAREKQGKRTYLAALRGRPRGPSAGEGAPRSHSPPGWSPPRSVPPSPATHPAEPTLQEARGAGDPACLSGLRIHFWRQGPCHLPVREEGSRGPGRSGGGAEVPAQGCGFRCKSGLQYGLLRPRLQRSQVSSRGAETDTAPSGKRRQQRWPLSGQEPPGREGWRGRQASRARRPPPSGGARPHPRGAAPPPRPRGPASARDSVPTPPESPRRTRPSLGPYDTPNHRPPPPLPLSGPLAPTNRITRRRGRSAA